MGVRQVEFEGHKFEIKIETGIQPDGTTTGRIGFADITKKWTHLGNASVTIPKSQDMMLLNGGFSFTGKQFGLAPRKGIELEIRLLEAAEGAIMQKFPGIKPGSIRGHVFNAAQGIRSFDIGMLKKRMHKLKQIDARAKKTKPRPRRRI